MKLPLVMPKDKRGIAQSWSSCLPFSINSRGVLVHRPKSVSMYRCGTRDAHLGVHYWCGNASTGTTEFTFFDADTPMPGLLCARCEAAAVRAGMPSANALYGHHVHEGTMVVQQTCCNREPPSGKEGS